MPLPVAFHSRRPDTDTPVQGQGVLRDISLSGAYFHVDPNMSFHPGQILSLTVSAPLPYLEDTDMPTFRLPVKWFASIPGAQPLPGRRGLSFLGWVRFLRYSPSSKCFKS